MSESGNRVSTDESSTLGEIQERIIALLENFRPGISRDLGASLEDDLEIDSIELAAVVSQMELDEEVELDNGLIDPSLYADLRDFLTRLSVEIERAR